MTWADTFNTYDTGHKLSESMKNIKLDSNVSPAEIQAAVKKYSGAATNVSGALQAQATAQMQMAPNQAVQFQPYTATSQYQPVQYNQAQYYPMQTPAYNYSPVATSYMQTGQQTQFQPYTAAPQYQAPPCYSYPPISQQIPSYTAGAPMTTSNAINAYSYQAQAPVQSGQNLNITTDATLAQGTNTNAQQASMPMSSVQ